MIATTVVHTVVHTVAGVVAADGSPPDPLVPELGEIILGLIAFGILCAVLMKAVFPQIEKAYADRRDAIEGGIARAEEEQAKARAAFEQYTAQLATAQTEAARFRDEARADATRIREEANATALAETARIQKAAEDRLAAERTGIVAELRAEIGGLAVDLAERIVGHQLASDAEQQRIVDTFIAELESGQGAGAPNAAEPTASGASTPAGTS
jgi:F-type H+-transporting ATPase subunit b